MQATNNKIKKCAELATMIYDSQGSFDNQILSHEFDAIYNISNSITDIKVAIYVQNCAVHFESSNKYKKNIFIVFAGSDNLLDFAYNLMAWQTQPHSVLVLFRPAFAVREDSASIMHSAKNLVKFHYGMHKQLMSIFPTIKSYMDDIISSAEHADIYLTGHSIGGCLAAITAYYFDKGFGEVVGSSTIITFGAPCFTNKHGTEWYKNNIEYIRIDAIGDPIPNLPIQRLGYTHVNNTTILLNTEENFQDNSQGAVDSKAEQPEVSLFKFIRLLVSHIFDLKYHKMSYYLNLIKAFLDSL